MSKTELEDVQALLERVVSEPGVFAGRLLQQAIAQYGLVSEPAATAFYTAMAEDVTASETVIVPDEWSADETSLDTNALLAAALGACECWGLREACRTCQGRGSAGLGPARPGTVRRVRQTGYQQAVRHSGPRSP